jgi:hypothetical protein
VVDSLTVFGASISAANATGKAKYAAAIGPTVTPPATTIAAVAIGLSFAVTPETMAQFSSAFEQIMGDTAVDDLSGYTVETFGRSARAASLGNSSKCNRYCKICCYYRTNSYATTHNNGSSSNWVIVRPVPNILYAGTMLTEAESEAQRAAYLEHVAMNKNMASEITKLLSNPLHQASCQCI